MKSNQEEIDTFIPFAHVFVNEKKYARYAETPFKARDTLFLSLIRL